MAELKGLGNPRVFDLRDGNEGMLDPFSLGANRGESTLLALETLRLLLGGSVSEEREEALLNAIEVVAQQPNPSLSKVVDNLVNNQQSAGARNLGAVLRTIRELPFAKLCFAATGGDALRPEDGLTVVTLLGLDLPSAMTKPEDYSYENRLAVSVMYLLTRYARQLMLNMDKSHPKAICIDEAWAITSTPQGAKLIPEIARMGRSHNTALVLVSQNAGDLMAEAVTNSISTKFAFRSSIPQEIDNVMDLMGLSRNQGYQGAVRDLRNGECLMQDVDGRVTRVYVDAWNRELFNTFNTNPETRGKASGTEERNNR
jgi:type IV secretory pathway VirB4 component